MSAVHRSIEDGAACTLAHNTCRQGVSVLGEPQASRADACVCRLCSREGTSSYVELVHRLLGRPAGLVLQIAIVAFGVGTGHVWQSWIGTHLGCDKQSDSLDGVFKYDPNLIFYV